ETQIADVVLKIRNQFIDQQIIALTQKLSHPEAGDEARMECLHEQQRLRQLKRSPLAPLEK
ncbi:MAG TPA: hypothetical protein VK815_07790, partial [Candidatus Acidoferrales bacterium]|nr:hypothetical protein [Candidatus Acidoferrales bacterium]